MTQELSAQWERKLSEALSQALLDSGWQVEVEPLIELYRPDLLATSPQGRVYAIELKTTRGPVHFGALAQVASYRSALSAFRDIKAQPVLFATGKTSESLEDLARSMDVFLAVEPATPSDPEVARRFAKRLLQLEQSRT